MTEVELFDEFVKGYALDILKARIRNRAKSNEDVKKIKENWLCGGFGNDYKRWKRDRAVG